MKDALFDAMNKLVMDQTKDMRDFEIEALREEIAKHQDFMKWVLLLLKDDNFEKFKEVHEYAERLSKKQIEIRGSENKPREPQT